MDKLLFKLNESDEFEQVEIYINNKSLIDIVREIELEGIPADELYDDAQIAGGYDFIFTGFLYNQLIDTKNRVTILECECHCPFCWDFNLSALESEGRVYWYGFNQPYREDWTYDRLPYFEFDKIQYQSELRKLKKWANKYNPESVKYREKLQRKLISRRKSQKK